MLKIKEKIEKLIENKDLIPDEFWVKTDGGLYETIWFMDRQKPSVERSYDFDEERFGITKEGKVIWGFDSGCSCPEPWSQNDHGDENYLVKEWKEFEVEPETAFDSDWEDECYGNLTDYLLLIDGVKNNLSPEKVLDIKNSEIRRFLIKRIGYQNIKDKVNAVVLHTDGDNELLKFENGEMYVKVKDSSTEREYLLYVEGGHTTCRSAIAWTFGLREEEYNPIIET